MTDVLDLLTRAVRDAPMPAVAVAVTTPAATLCSVVSGTERLGSSTPATPMHYWDLASLTKTLVTLPEVLSLVDDGSICLDSRIEDVYPPAVGTDIGTATVAQLLSYDAGLPQWLPFFSMAHTARDVLTEVLKTKTVRPPGSGAEYSDIGFIVLGEVVTELTQTSLNVHAARRGFATYAPVYGRAIATEYCPWRGRLLYGEAHDENAAALGGVAGHAGAFAQLDGVVRAVQSWLRRDLVSATLHDLATTCWSSNAGGERFGLGWWLAPTRGLGGRFASSDGFGSSGYVGNRIWIEPRRGYGIVILSNRVHPQRGDRAPFDEWCSAVVDAVALAW